MARSRDNKPTKAECVSVGVIMLSLGAFGIYRATRSLKFSQSNFSTLNWLFPKAALTTQYKVCSVIHGMRSACVALALVSMCCFYRRPLSSNWCSVYAVPVGFMLCSFLLLAVNPALISCSMCAIGFVLFSLGLEHFGP